MTNLMTYKGYQGGVEFSHQDDCLHGRILNINDIVTYEGNSLDEIKTAFRESVDDYLAFCAETGKKPDKAFSGKLMFRVDPKVHAKAAQAAQMKGISLNQWAEEVLAKAAGN